MSPSDQLAEALLDPSKTPPPMIVAVGNRFDIYRNNVVASLTEALAKTFPVVQRLVGTEYFSALVRQFVRRNPPASKILADFGAALPGFIGGFPPLVDYPYLADVARLEWARLQVMRAADAPTFALATGGPLDLAAIVELPFALAPSAQLLASEHPIASLWLGQTESGDAEEIDWQAECLMVFRSGRQVVHARLRQPEFEFFKLLPEQRSLGDALLALADPAAAPDMLHFTVNLLEAGALVPEYRNQPTI